MSWRDITKIDESTEDTALREELQNMLGFSPVEQVHTDPDPSSIALVQSLYREATRRRRTASVVKPHSRRPLFMLAAATIPVLLTVTALGTWGVKQKRRADTMAAKALELESRQNRMDAAREGARGRENQLLLQASEHKPDASPDTKRNRTPENKGELVKPEEAPSRLNNRSEQILVGTDR